MHSTFCSQSRNKMTSFKMGLFVAAAILCTAAVCDGRTLRDKLMYPWGPHEGDQPGYRDWMVPFNNTESISYFRKEYSDVYLCPGGRIGFSSIAGFRCGIDKSQATNQMRTSDWTNIAAFGVTHSLYFGVSRPNVVYLDYYQYYDEIHQEIFKTENLWFRVTKDESLLGKASIDVQRHFQGCHQNFKPKELFIATWSDAHDIDFCETHELEEPLCSCVIEAPFILFNSKNLQNEPSYLLCTCIHEYNHSARYCTCYVIEKIQHHYYYLHDLYDVSDSWCECLHQNDYNEDLCDCQILNICSGMDKRQLLPMKRKVEQETNSYQIVIMTDGSQSYAMFNYLDINWIYVNTYEIVYPYPYYYNPVRIYAEVGFEQKNGPSYHHPYSTSDDLYKLVNETNTGMPGRWMYKISGRNIKAPGCVKLSFD